MPPRRPKDTMMAETVKRTLAEFTAELTARFGDDPMTWAFTCPACEDVATGQDMADALAHRARADEPLTRRVLATGGA